MATDNANPAAMRFGTGKPEEKPAEAKQPGGQNTKTGEGDESLNAAAGGDPAGPGPTGEDLKDNREVQQQGISVSGDQTGRNQDANIGQPNQGATDEELKAGLEEATDRQDSDPEVVDDSVTYSSHPIHRFSIGDYQFTDGQLKLTPEQAVKFDKLLATTPPQTRMQIKKLDVNSANQTLARIQSRTTTGIATTRGTFRPPSEG